MKICLCSWYWRGERIPTTCLVGTAVTVTTATCAAMTLRRAEAGKEEKPQRGPHSHWLTFRGSLFRFRDHKVRIFLKSFLFSPGVHIWVSGCLLMTLSRLGNMGWGRGNWEILCRFGFMSDFCLLFQDPSNTDFSESSYNCSCILPRLYSVRETVDREHLFYLAKEPEPF